MAENVEGKSKSEPSRANASKLQHSYSISERVAEIMAEREKVHGQATAAAIERVALTKTWGPIRRIIGL